MEISDTGNGLPADELERAISKLNLKGMQIGSNINGKNLDEPEFEPVWAVANQHHAFCMVHPNNVAGIDRMKKYYLNNLIGNPLDPTIAAVSVVQILLIAAVMLVTDRYVKQIDELVGNKEKEIMEV